MQPITRPNSNCPHALSANSLGTLPCPICGETITSAPDLATADYAGPPASGPGSDATVTCDTPTRNEPAPAHPSADRIGRFEIRGRLGEGAFGEVFRAYDSQLDREVALKVAKPSALGTDERVQRFLREAKAAANLRHPNIVPLFDAGQSDGRYFIASAFVRGRTLEAEIAAAAGKPMDLHRAAAVIRRLAEALGYAHRMGITHRDVKPANTLVDEAGEPHLLDFGLAARSGDDTLQTQDGRVLGTPAYMSPEQAAGRSAEATAASDQYALGVILFEMATGKRPFSGSMESVMFHHIEVEPPRPRAVNPGVPRDLETVILKCLEKEAGKRYPSCEALAEDLRRFLAGEPVSARRVGPLERAGRWAKRNPAVAGSLSVAVLALVLGSGVSLWQAVRAGTEAERASGEARRADTEASVAQRQEGIAREQAARAEGEAANALSQAKRAEAVAALMAGLFRSSDPTGLSGIGLLPPNRRSRSVTAAEILVQGSKDFADKFRDDPLARAALLDVMGDVNRSVGNMDLAKGQLEESLKIRMELLPADHDDVAASRYHMATWHCEKGNTHEAEPLYLKLLARHEARGTLDSLPACELQLRMSVALALIGDPEAEPYARRALATREKLCGPGHRDTDIARMVLASTLLDQNKMEESTQLFLSTFQSLSKNEAARSDLTVQATFKFQEAMVLSSLNPQLGEAAMKHACELMGNAVGADHLYLSIFKYELGSLLKRRGKTAEAEANYRDCLGIVRKTVGLGHPRALILVNSLADFLWQRGRPNEAWELIEEAHADALKRYPDEFRWRFRLLCLHGRFAGKLKKADVALRDADSALALIRGFNRPMTGNEESHFAALAFGIGLLDDLPKIRAFQARIAPPDGPALSEKYRRAIRLNHSATLFEHRQYAEAEPLLRAIARDGPPADADYLGSYAYAISNFAQCLWRNGLFEEAEKWLRESLRLEKTVGTPSAIAQDTAMLMKFLILRQKWKDVPALAVAFGSTPKSAPYDRVWAALLQAAMRSLEVIPAAEGVDLDRVEELFGTTPEVEIAACRARIVMLAGADRKRERERLEVLLRKDPKRYSLVEVLACYDLLDGEPAKAHARLTQYTVYPTAPARQRMHSVLVAHAKMGIAPNAETTKTLNAALAEAERFLKASEGSKVPDWGGAEITHLLELRFWCRRIRADMK